jgi:HTH-type transcriptional regulator/antitoxin HigA
MIGSDSVDRRKYGRLLAEVQPRPTATEEENDQMLVEVNRLMSKGEDKLSPEEHVLLELLTTLIERFEDEHYPIAKAPGHEVLNFLMEDRGLRQRDLLHIFGSRGIASEVVNGKRSISKTQAKKLGNFFHVAPDLFI